MIYICPKTRYLRGPVRKDTGILLCDSGMPPESRAKIVHHLSRTRSPLH